MNIKIYRRAWKDNTQFNLGTCEILLSRGTQDEYLKDGCEFNG